MQSQVPPRRPIRPIVINRDNAAKQAWRRLEPPTDKITVNRTFVETATNNPYVALKNTSFPKMNQLANETETHIQVKPCHRSDELAILWLWGAADKVANVKKEINHLDTELGGKSTGVANWARTWNLTPQLKEKLNAKVLNDERRQTYRQEPSTNASFPAYGFFPWPIEQYPLEETLGKSYEALDPIRIDFSCHIVWDNRRSCLKIMGNENYLVIQALARVHGAFRQVEARQVEAGNFRLLQLPIDSNIPFNIRLSNSLPSNVLSDTVIPQTPCATVKADVKRIGKLPESVVYRDRGIRAMLNAKKMKDSLLRLISKLCFYQGNIKMQLRLGTFVVQNHKNCRDNGWLFEDFEALLKEELLTGTVTEGIGNKQLEQQILERVLDANSLLAPATTFARTLREDKPIYCANFVIVDPTDGSCFCYDVAFKDLGASFECSSRDWSKLDPGSTNPTKLLDISLIDLQKSSAWALEVTATQTISDDTQVPQSFLQWAERVEIDGQRARNHDKPGQFIAFPAGVPIVFYKEKVVWTFHLIGSLYTVEIGRTQRTATDRSQMLSRSPNAVPNVLQDPYWTVAVRHNDWNGFLGTHANLKVGEGAKYTVDEKKWFPKDDTCGSKHQDGFLNLVEKLGQIEGIVRGDSIECKGNDHTGDPFTPSFREPRPLELQLEGDEDMYLDSLI
ncbi:MAG: hypothetical protein M1821_005501 [Bathelium mastoideum]|nr:MAG: hypothetical protein M1821_005501 [Bathelium mastoideum]KAI9691830.1 MAG: hypothetical protein M1822_007902 [Bathelium mastoideum]